MGLELGYGGGVAGCREDAEALGKIVKDLRAELNTRVPDENLTALRCGVAFSIRTGERSTAAARWFHTSGIWANRFTSAAGTTMKLPKSIVRPVPIAKMLLYSP